MIGGFLLIGLMGLVGMVVMASSDLIFDDRIYIELATIAGKYYRENINRSSRIPRATTKKLDAKKYKKPLYDKTKNFVGGDEYTVSDVRMETYRSAPSYRLGSWQAFSHFGKKELLEEGSYLAQTKGEQFQEMARQIDLTIWKGLYTKGYDENGDGVGWQIVNGVLDQATTVEDLNGGDSVLDAAGDVFLALVKMLTSIPFRLRQSRDVVFGMTSHFFEAANNATFTYTGTATTEWEAFFDKFIAKGIPGFKVSKDVIISDEVFEQSTDTGGATDDRLFSAIFGTDIIERAFSRNLSVLGEVSNVIGGKSTSYGARLRGCVHNAEAVLFSELITWA